jgi:hypothetical protein
MNWRLATHKSSARLAGTTSSWDACATKWVSASSTTSLWTQEKLRHTLALKFIGQVWFITWKMWDHHQQGEQELHDPQKTAELERLRDEARQSLPLARRGLPTR